jgi:hypothetical protein
MQNLYRGDGICHNVIVHPPGRLVSWDTLDLRLAWPMVRMAWSCDTGCHGSI